MIVLRDMMDKPEGWGRDTGRVVFSRLVEHVERNPNQIIFPISFRGVKQIDYSFSSETIVQLARRYKGLKGFYIVDINTPYIEENVDAAARRVEQPLFVLDEKGHRFIGLEPSAGTKAALDFVLARPQARAVEIADAIQVTVANASMKLKQLWTSGFLLRRESVADTGGVEFIYHRIA